MIYLGIDISEDRHNCFIRSSEGEVLADVFTIPNNAEGFDARFKRFAAAPVRQTK